MSTPEDVRRALEESGSGTVGPDDTNDSPGSEPGDRGAG